ncbi:MAG: caspase family protein [Chitinophagales bacterium]
MKHIFIFFTLLLLLFLNIYGQNEVEKPTLHVIFFATTTDETIGDGNKRSLVLLDSLISKIENTKILTVNKSFYIDSNFTTYTLDSVMLALYKNKSIKKNDIVFFYFLGHGINKGNNISPDLIFKQYSSSKPYPEQKRNLETVGYQLMDLGARLTLVFAEACNNFEIQDAQVQLDDNDVYNVASDEWINPKRLADLFLYSKGYIIMSSSDLGEFSYINKMKGGIFTQFFTKKLSEYASNPKNNIEWESLLKNIRDSVFKFTKKIKFTDEYGKKINTKQQSPFYYELSVLQEIPLKERVVIEDRIEAVKKLMKLLPHTNKDNIKNCQNFKCLQDYALTPEKLQKHHRESPFAYHLTLAILAEYNGKNEEAFIYYKITQRLAEKKSSADNQFIKDLIKLDKKELEFGFTETYKKWLTQKIKSYLPVIENVEKCETTIKDKLEKIEKNRQ